MSTSAELMGTEENLLGEHAVPPEAADPARTHADPAGSPPPSSGQPRPLDLGVSIEHRRQRIRVETQRHRIEGYVTLARDGFRSRVSDMLNASERDFLILTEATVAPLADGQTESHGFLAIARRHIVFAVVIDEED